MAGRREASALLAVIVALVLIEALVAGTLIIVTYELAAARAYRSSVHARLAAESALAATVHAWPLADAAALPMLGRLRVAPDSVVLPGTSRFDAELERIDAETYLLRGNGTAAEPDTAFAVAAALLRTLDRSPLRALVGAALTAVGAVSVEAGAALHGEAAPPVSLDCVQGFPDADRPIGAAPAAIVADADALVVAADADIRGATITTPSAAEDPFSVLRTGLGPDLAIRADRVEDGAVIAFPSATGTSCDRDADGNWGDPEQPVAPCGRYAPLIFAPGDLTLAAGAGQGILIIAGDLTIMPAARFAGVVIVAGALDLQAGATLEGGVRLASASGVSRIAGAIEYDGCSIARALALAPALARPSLHPSRPRLPAW